MERQQSVLSIKNYGETDLKLKALMDSRNISRNYLARSINARFEVIDKWYNNDVEKLDLDILSRICFVLDCKIEDLLEYRKP